MDVIMMTYANNQQKPLPNLTDEAQYCYDAMARKAMDRNFFPFYEPFVTINRLNAMTKEYEGYISMFSFSGHAGRDRLVFTDQHANPTGLGLLLKSSVTSKKLKLVMLNGCATRDQVEGLLAVGVPVVIATSAPVDDMSASRFAKAFYGELAKEATIINAFNKALPFAQLGSRENLKDKVPRDAAHLETLPADEPMWEIFSPNPADAQKTVVPFYDSKALAFRSMEKILKSLYIGFLNAENPAIVALSKMEAAGLYVQKHLKEGAIANSVPRLIGSQLDKLLIVDREKTPGLPSRALTQIAQVYYSIIEFMSIVLIAQLWEFRLYLKTAKMQHDVPIPETIRKMLKNYINANRQDNNCFDHAPVILEIIAYLSKCANEGAYKRFFEKQYVVNDFQQLNNERLRKTSGILLELRTKTANNINIDAELGTYNKFEDALCDLCRDVSFLHRYKLKSVRLIETIKERYEPEPKFKHNIIPLNQIADELVINKYSRWLDSYGVIIVLKDDDDKTVDYLNLSPFIIDKNVFDMRATTSHIVIFNQKTPEYIYKDGINPTRHYNKLLYAHEVVTPQPAGEFLDDDLTEEDRDNSMGNDELLIMKIQREFDVFANDVLND